MDKKNKAQRVADAFVALAREAGVSFVALIEECDGEDRRQTICCVGRPHERVILAATLYGAEREQHESLLADAVRAGRQAAQR